MINLPPRHNSMRGYFGYELYKLMARDERIMIITANLGYGLFDFIKRDFKTQFVDSGSSEQAAVGIAVGLASEGKIPIVYSITTFLLYRPFEIIRNYLDKQGYPVKLVGSGRSKDYWRDGLSHWSEDAKYFLDGFPNIVQFWPENNKQIGKVMKEFLYNTKPSFLSLKR